MIPSKIDPNETITCQGWEIKKLVLEAKIKAYDNLLFTDVEEIPKGLVEAMISKAREELQELTKGGSND